MTPADHDHSLSQEQSGVHVGFNEKFERRWWIAQRLTWAVFVCVLAGGIAGLFGRGPLDKRTLRLPKGLIVHYSHILRYRTPSSITMEIPVRDGKAEFSIDKTSIERLGLRQILPMATKVLGSIGAGPFRYEAAAPGERSVYVELQCYPASVGTIRSMIFINNDREIVLRQFMVP